MPRDESEGLFNKEAEPFRIHPLSCSGGNATISPRIVLVPIVPNPFLVYQPHFCENSWKPASTVEHYSIPYHYLPNIKFLIYSMDFTKRKKCKM